MLQFIKFEKKKKTTLFVTQSDLYTSKIVQQDRWKEIARGRKRKRVSLARHADEKKHSRWSSESVDTRMVFRVRKYLHR